MGVTFDVSGLDALAARFAHAEAVVVARTQVAVISNAEHMVRIAQAHALVRTGTLRDNIGFDLDPDGMGATVGPDTGARTPDGKPLNYGPYVEYGTRPHEIRAKDGGVLAWQGAEGPAFARSVQHPGTTAHPFMAPAAAEVLPRFAAEVLAIGRGAL